MNKQELEEIVRSYQNVGRENIYELKKYTDEAENVVYANQLQKRRSYPIIYGNENPGYVNGQFVIQGNISPRAVQIP